MSDREAVVVDAEDDFLLTAEEKNLKGWTNFIDTITPPPESMSWEEREAIIAMAEADLLPEIAKPCVECEGDGCKNCDNSGFDAARKAKQLGGLTYSQGYKAEDIYRKFVAQFHDETRDTPGHDAVVDVLNKLERQPCPSCQGVGEVEHQLSPVLGGGVEKRKCPACKGTRAMKDANESVRIQRRNPIRGIRKEKFQVLQDYKKIRESKLKG